MFLIKKIYSFYKEYVLLFSSQHISLLHLRCGPNALILVTQGSWRCLGWAGHGRIVEKSWESFAPGWLGQGWGGSVRPRVGNRSMRKLVKSRNRFKYDNCSTFLETRGWSLNTITDRTASEISKYDGLVRMDSPLIYTMHQITHPRLKFGYL